jgi:hypothetical protein
MLTGCYRHIAINISDMSVEKATTSKLEQLTYIKPAQFIQSIQCEFCYKRIENTVL